MIYPKLHIVMVSDQAAANVLPTLDKNMRPEKVILLSTKKMINNGKAEYLQKILKENKILTELFPIEQENDFKQLESIFIDLACSDSVAKYAESIALNMTGGTKLMALAAYSCVAVTKWKMFYLDIDTSQVTWLGKEDAFGATSLSDTIGLKAYFTGYGFEVLEDGQGKHQPNISKNQEDFLKQIIQFPDIYSTLIGQFNQWAYQSKNVSLLEFHMNRQLNENEKYGLEQFSKQNILNYTLSDKPIITFVNESARFFAFGGWIEFLVYQTLSKIKKDTGIKEHRMNIELRKIKDGNKNEIDAVFLKNNRLFVIECKTARYGAAQDGKANDALYKLSSLTTNMGGLAAKGVFITYRKLSDAEYQLANALNIEVFSGNDLKNLEHKFRSLLG